MERLDANEPIACSLNDTEFRERRTYARQKLIPKITKFERIPNGLIFRFTPEARLETYLNTFVELERQCCGFLAFTILPDATDISKAAGLKIEGPAEAAATIEMFAQAAEAAAA